MPEAHGNPPQIRGSDTPSNSTPDKLTEHCVSYVSASTVLTTIGPAGALPGLPMLAGTRRPEAAVARGPPIITGHRVSRAGLTGRPCLPRR